MMGEWLPAALSWLQSLGVAGAGVSSVVESGVCPAPTLTVMVALVLASPRHAWLAASICAVGSMVGAGIGHGLGRTAGRSLFRRWASEQAVARVEKMTAEHGLGALWLASVSPLPFFLFTQMAGVFGLRAVPVMGVSLVGRAVRFYAVAGAVRLLGAKAGVITAGVAGLLMLAGAALWKAVQRRRAGGDPRGG